MVNETRKIMRDDSIRVTATTVRIPVMGGHSESVNVEFAHDFNDAELRALLAATVNTIADMRTTLRGQRILGILRMRDPHPGMAMCLGLFTDAYRILRRTGQP